MDREPNQREDDLLLDDCLRHGDKTRIASILGVPFSTLKRRLNPDDDQLNSSFYEFKRFLWALDSVNPHAGDVALADLQSCHETWTSEAKPASAGIAQDLGSVATETAELICARLKGHPTHVQRKEAMDIIAAVNVFIAGLEQESRSREVKA